MGDTTLKQLVFASCCLILFRCARTLSLQDSSEQHQLHERINPHEKVDHQAVKYAAVQFSFARHFQDHMVLQQAPAQANVYGFSPFVGQTVTLQIVPSPLPIVYKTTVQPGPEIGVGVWSFTLDPVKTNVSVEIIVHSLRDTISLVDVVFGDVWICSGQSNMEFTVIQMFGAADELNDAHNYPMIRIMTVENVQSSTPLYNLQTIRQNWTAPSNATIGGPAWSYFSAVCWLYGKAIHKALGYPIGLVASDWGGTPVEAWSSKDALSKCGVSSKESKHDRSSKGSVKHSPHDEKLGMKGPGNNSVLWNAMIYPLLNMTIKGAIWYQGENDASGEMMVRYNCTFPAMISDWRDKFHNFSHGQTDRFFPFGFVQLAPNRPSPEETVGFPDIRWHQTGDFGYVPNIELINVFMAVSMDLPDFNSSFGSIHPRDKKDVGDRLVLSGLAVAYGKNTTFQGPLPNSYEIMADGIKLDYGQWWDLEVRVPTGFEFACSFTMNSLWIPSTIIASTQTSVTLARTCSQDYDVTSVRYAWRESPCGFKQCAVYETKNGLPAPPFIANFAESPKGYFPFEFDGQRYRRRL